MTVEYNKIFEPIDKTLTLDKAKKAALNRLGIETLIELLLYKPINYRQKHINPNLTSLKYGEEVIIKVEIKEIEYPSLKSKQPVKIFASNESGGITLTFFKFPSYIKNFYKIGQKLTIAGKVEIFDYRPQLNHPEIIFDPKLISASEPRYGLTYGLTNSQVRNYIYKTLPHIQSLPEWLPPELVLEHSLPSFHHAIKAIHNYGSAETSLEKAIHRFKIDEALSNQLGFKYLKEKNLVLKGQSYQIDKSLKQQVIDKLGFELTMDQKTVIEEIEADQLSSNQMLRMVQGDVGCGKTIVAILTALNVISSGFQVALMVPTDVLAQQHYNFAKKLLTDIGLNIALLTGKVTGKLKLDTLNTIENGEANLIIGTHALFQEKVKFNKLGYIIVDEQHRFGVNQRMELISKGEHPDVLIMSATPIPRSLSLTMFGDLAISQIKTMPATRKPIKTLVASIEKINDVCNAIMKKLEQNEKIFWICPLIEQQNEEEKKLPFIDVETRYAYLSNIFNQKVAFLHGSLPADTKNNLLNSLKEGTINILVATTVIEVGIDIPDATLIIIENAEQFGLAQLHQLRGRVGRGDKESMCILLYGKYTSKIAFERLKILRESQDGFYIAEQDLKLRGEGDLLGEKQSGEQNFRFLDIAQDSKLIASSHMMAKNLVIDSNRLLQISIYNKSIITRNIIA